MARNDRVYDPYTGRCYKRGYSPEELTREPITATCGRCGGPAELWPIGLICPTCSGAGAREVAVRANDRERVRRGYTPASEL